MYDVVFIREVMLIEFRWILANKSLLLLVFNKVINLALSRTWWTGKSSGQVDTSGKSHLRASTSVRSGELCETDIDNCEEEPCDNNGTCIDQVNSFNCECQAGYTGHNCSVSV